VKRGNAANEEFLFEEDALETIKNFQNSL